MCFNPRSRTGNDVQGRVRPHDFYVSIHVPARGTTHNTVQQSSAVQCFNPRSRTGNDGYSFRALSTSKRVSIHVPARGTTKHSYNYAFLFPSFNPRSRTGNDVVTLITGRQEKQCFNPRSRTGNDSFQYKAAVQSEVSIHVPARGTTEYIRCIYYRYRFQSTFPHGERR